MSGFEQDTPLTIHFNGEPFFGPELFLQLILEPLLTYLLPQKGALSLHASSLSYNGKGVIFTGSTGVGKTSILLTLLKLPGTIYMSDDQTLVKDCTIYPYPLEIGLRKHHLSRIGIDTTSKHKFKMNYHSILKLRHCHF